MFGPQWWAVMSDGRGARFQTSSWGRHRHAFSISVMYSCSGRPICLVSGSGAGWRRARAPNGDRSQHRRRRGPLVVRGLQDQPDVLDDLRPVREQDHRLSRATGLAARPDPGEGDTEAPALEGHQTVARLAPRDDTVKGLVE